MQTKYVKCLECDEIGEIPISFNQNWFMCFDCGLFREIERIEKEKNEQYN